MNYLITGGTGLIGSAICRQLLASGHTVTVLSRDRDKVHRQCGYSVVAITGLEEISPTEKIDSVINLAGAPIADARWTTRRKTELERSRIEFTDTLVAWLAQRTDKPRNLISASAVGWYGDGGETLLSEDGDFTDDYAHRLCDQWENAALKAEQYGIRVCLVRTGLVLSANGGFLQRMLLPFKLGIGGRIGHGRQFMPWIHINDIAALFIFLSHQSNASGVFNGCAPHPVTNQDFSKCLASQLNRPALLPLPAWGLKLALGEMSALLLGGQHAIPQKAQAAGFKFQYTELDSALRDVLN